MKVLSFISFDVEALPGRASDDHINRLIWGRINGKEYGIKRICQILSEYKIKANFMIDIAACSLYGDRDIQKVGEYILNEGHELHAHLHSEWLVRKWMVPGVFNGPAGLNQLDDQINNSFVHHTFFKFRQLFGIDPQVFRGGGFKFNEFTVAAAKSAGFKCLSNFNTQRHLDQVKLDGALGENEPFMWSNGLMELPVDFSPEPLSFPFEKYYDAFDRVLHRKNNKTFNLTMHSWSLLKKVGNYFENPEIIHEIQFRQILEHLQQHSTISGYTTFINNAELLSPCSFTFAATASPSKVDPKLICNICKAIFQEMSSDVCPGCGGRMRHRQIKSSLELINNPFDSKYVLANFANSVEKNILLSRCSGVLNFDIRPVGEVDVQMDIQNMLEIQDSSFDGFVAIHVLNHVKDDEAALREIHRVLKPHGIALITVPYRIGSSTTTLENITEHYGKEALDDYGVGSYRRYGLDDVIKLFSIYFECQAVDGIDPISGQSMKIFLLTKY
jgi:SAM-dependent methyltransferase